MTLMLSAVRLFASALGPRYSVQVRSGFERNLEPLVALCAEFQTPLWFNRNTSRAIENKAGLHGGARYLSQARVQGFAGSLSMPVHSALEMTDAAEIGAELALVSPVFFVPGKDDPMGVAGFSAIVSGAPKAMKVFALGGIGASNLDQIEKAPRIDGVACIRASWESPSDLLHALTKD
jgi:thiamine monophosphate synthase